MSEPLEKNHNHENSHIDGEDPTDPSLYPENENPSGKYGLGETHGNPETNPTPDFEDGPTQAVSEALRADKAVTFAHDLADAVDQNGPAPEIDAAATSEADLPGQEDPSQSQKSDWNPTVS